MPIAAEFKSGAGSEGGHWYAPGPPVECMYEIKGANGEWRPTTMKDARKFGWFPGITSIAGQEGKPGLERWKIDQGILAALTHPKVHEVTDADQLMAMLREDGEAQAKTAREKGTRLHAAIERHFQSGEIDLEYARHIEGVREQLYMLTGRDDLNLWRTEEAHCHPWGFGTRIDLHSPELQMVVDFKGKDLGIRREWDRKLKQVRKIVETPENWKPEGYPEQARQLAACLAMLKYGPQGRGVNLFVARNYPGLVRAHEWDPADLRKAWLEFVALLTFWCIKNSFPLRMKLSPEMRAALEVA